MLTHASTQNFSTPTNIIILLTRTSIYNKSTTLSLLWFLILSLHLPLFITRLTWRSLFPMSIQSEASFILLFLCIDWEIPQLLLPPNAQLKVHEFPEYMYFEKETVWCRRPLKFSSQWGYTHPMTLCSYVSTILATISD